MKNNLREAFPGSKKFENVNKKYFIKKYYRRNLNSEGKAIPYLDNDEDSSHYQYAVYKFAQEILKQNNLSSVLDIGCGVGTKLTEIIYPVCKDITGIDAAYSIEKCRQKYSFGQWLVEDLESPKLELNRDFDLIISADVIEHLVDPDRLLSCIKKFASKNTFIIISTPDRDIVRGENHFGPAANVCHVREWNMDELSKYLENRNFRIIKHFLTECKKGSSEKSCQVVFCKVK